MRRIFDRNTDVELVAFWVSKPVKERLRVRAAEQGVGMSKLLRELVAGELGLAPESQS